MPNRILDIELQTVHLPLSDVERMEEDLVGDIAPTPVRELYDRNIKGGILWEHRR